LGKAPRDLGKAIRDRILRKDRRYAVEAYRFIYEALDHTIRKAGERRHVSGQELLDGIRDLALELFGPLGKTVFNSWGIHRTEDFGEIVFNLVDAELMSKNESDTRGDFKDGFNFDEVFSFKA
jgi:uncharacterized repeat protein (TIGR04138 family)